jgi:type II secretory pathway pseudopilin PulG
MASRSRGMTLIELAVAVAVLLGIGLLLSLLLSSGLDLWEAGTAQTGADQEARLALERVTRELRASRSTAGQVVIGGGGSSLTFPLDMDNDGSFETTVRYLLDGAVLRRRQAGAPLPGDPVAQGISSAVFSTLAGGSLVAATLRVSAPREGEKGVGEVAMRSGAHPRND